MTVPSAATLRVLRLDGAGTPAAAALLARAFDRDPFSRLVAPDPRLRSRLLAHKARLQLDAALPYGHVFGAMADGALCGVAIWLPPGVSPGLLAPAVRRLPAAAGLMLPSVGVAARLGRVLAGCPTGVARLLLTRWRAVAAVKATPTWNLAMIGTDPAHQRRGVGRRLLEHLLPRADADGTPVWLETLDTRNVAWYGRFGFEVTGHVPGGRALSPWWVMRRPSRAG